LYYGNTYKKISWRHSLNHLVEDGLRVASSLYNTIDYGLLQAFADALKLLLKEYVAPTQANIILFFLGPVITLIFALLGYGVIP